MKIRKAKNDAEGDTGPCRKKRRRRKYEVGGAASKRSYDKGPDEQEIRNFKRRRKMVEADDDLDKDAVGCGMTKANVVDVLVCESATATLDEVGCDKYDFSCKENVTTEESAQSGEEGQLHENSNLILEDSGPTSLKANKQPVETIGKKPMENSLQTVFKFTARLLDTQEKRKLKTFADVMMENLKNKAHQPTSLNTKTKRKKKQLPPIFSHRTMKDFFKPVNSTSD